MKRPLVVVGEARPVMSHVENPAVERDEVERRRIAHADARACLPVGGLERPGSEQAQNIGKQQLLMLLLVIDAELDKFRRLRRKWRVEQAVERLIDRSAIGAHLMAGGPREQSALRPRVPGADALVIGIEAVLEALVEHAIAGQEALQHESLEEPGGVGEMPLGRARIVHGLDDLVLVAQRARKPGGERPRLDQAVA